MRENLSAKGAYRLKAAEGPRKVIILATGSEVEIAVAVAANLEQQGIGADVVSLPCTEAFDAQPVLIARTSSPTCRTARSFACRSRPGHFRLERYTGSTASASARSLRRLRAGGRYGISGSQLPRSRAAFSTI